MFIYVCGMADERIPGAPQSTNITPEMRDLFLSLGVDRVKCYECGRSSLVESMIWDNQGMWFVCSTCAKSL